MVSYRIFIVLAVILKDSGLNEAASLLLNEKSTPSSELNVGDEINIFCEAKGADASISIRKLTRDKEDILMKGQVGLKKDCQRFKTSFEVSQDVAYFSLQITNAQPEDSGNYYCSWQKGGIKTEFRNYTVPGKLVSAEIVERIQLQQDSNATYNTLTAVKVNESDQGISIGCRVFAEKTLVMPSVRIFSENEDVTSFFIVDDSKTQDEAFEWFETSCARTANVYVTLLRQVTKTFRHFHGKDLRCVAELGKNKLEASAQVNVIYKPVLTCERSRVSLEANKMVTFNCTASGNPKPKLYWTRGVVGQEEILDDTDEKNGLKSELIASNRYSVQGTLTARVTPENVAKIFYVMANSTIGYASRRLVISEAAAGGQDGLLPNIVLSLSISSLYYLLFHCRLFSWEMMLN
ncbi:DgyrCDS13057 [Dimorphilus gyrociliatus]|uniref:DgyrCDS13057 n=1 Tax=Dimorphilus gyrociliatus TaxID=2664684 RepID=A0A7I8W9I4_9ANNE|nr:DgyrCDS13057 [Dimorphilus gyrociliatus]